MGLFDFFKHHAKDEVHVETLQPTPGEAVDIKYVMDELAEHEAIQDSHELVVPEDAEVLQESEATAKSAALSESAYAQLAAEASIAKAKADAASTSSKQAQIASTALSESTSASTSTILVASTSTSKSQSTVAALANAVAESESVSKVASASAAQDAFELDSVSTSESEVASASLEQSMSMSVSASLEAKAVVQTAESEDFASETNDLDQGLTKTRRTWSERWNHFMANFRSVDEDFFDDLEETLISADVGAQTALTLTDELRDEVKLKNAKSQDDVSKIIIQKLVDLYERQGIDEDTTMHLNSNGLTVILFVGVNGVGKTTTIGKMSHRYKQAGKQVLLAAADTFRAGATEQLVEWGQRNDIPVVTGKANSDPASVVYDGVKQAQATQADILFVDTAGRLQNNVNLMQELAKMKRIIQREIPEAPQEVLLVLDATTGQNALQQARLFKDSTDVTGIVLTKLDGTAKGGIILPIRNELHVPVKWIGIGEKVTDLQPFNADAFVKGLFGRLLEE